MREFWLVPEWTTEDGERIDYTAVSDKKYLRTDKGLIHVIEYEAFKNMVDCLEINRQINEQNEIIHFQRYDQLLEQANKLEKALTSTWVDDDSRFYPEDYIELIKIWQEFKKSQGIQ